MAKSAKKIGIHTIGRRKTSVARVFLREGSGNITVNNKPYQEYFGRATSQMVVRQPMRLTETLEKFDVLVTVEGGGPSGQAGAVRHGISRALSVCDREAYRAPLKQAGLISRDAREVERKKYGHHKARRSVQYSKR